MRLYAGGDLSAFEEIYARYEGRIYGFCLRFLGERDQADDAFQDVFVRIISAAREYRPRGRFAQWAFTIARRVCIDRQRERRRGAEVLDESVAAHSGRSAAESVAAGDELDRLLGALPPEQREVILLSRLYGFSYEEIAEMVGVSGAAVKQKIYRAMQSLRGSRKSGT